MMPNSNNITGSKSKIGGNNGNGFSRGKFAADILQTR